MIQINNLSEKIAQYQAKISAAVERVIASGWLVLGPEVKRFEKSFSAYLGADYCIGLANGTDAIELALKATGVGSGDLVATVANAGMYTTTALQAMNAEPWFMDVDLDTCNVTFEEVVRAVDAGVKAVVVTHLYGLAIPEISKIAQYCSEKGVYLIEDCAQAHGAQVDGKQVGTFGDAASFSFYPTKNLGALGDGGAVVTNSPKIAERVSHLRQYGWTKKYHTEVAGARNSRLDEMQAAILSEFLPHLDESNARRRDISAKYNEEIRHSGVKTFQLSGDKYVAHLYVIRTKSRDALRDHLQALNIVSDIHYPIPDYRQPLFGDRFSSVRLENTERLANEILTLPCYPEMANSEVDKVIEAVNKWQA